MPAFTSPQRGDPPVSSPRCPLTCLSPHLPGPAKLQRCPMVGVWPTLALHCGAFSTIPEGPQALRFRCGWAAEPEGAVEEHSGAGNILCHCPPAMGQVAVSPGGDLVPSWLDPVAAVQLCSWLFPPASCRRCWGVHWEPWSGNSQCSSMTGRTSHSGVLFPPQVSRISLLKTVVSGGSAGPGSPLSVLAGAGDLVWDRKFLSGGDWDSKTLNSLQLLLIT